VYFLAYTSGQDPVKPGLSAFHRLYLKHNMGCQLNYVSVSQYKAMLIPFALTGNCEELICLSQIRVLLGTIIGGLYVLTLVRRNWE